MFLREDLKRLVANLNKQKDKLKKNGIQVDGRHYRIRFKGTFIGIYSLKVINSIYCWSELASVIYNAMVSRTPKCAFWDATETLGDAPVTLWVRRLGIMDSLAYCPQHGVQQLWNYQAGEVLLFLLLLLKYCFDLLNSNSRLQRFTSDNGQNRGGFCSWW